MFLVPVVKVWAEPRPRTTLTRPNTLLMILALYPQEGRLPDPQQPIRGHVDLLLTNESLTLPQADHGQCTRLWVYSVVSCPDDT